MANIFVGHVLQDMRRNALQFEIREHFLQKGHQ